MFDYTKSENSYSLVVSSNNDFTFFIEVGVFDPSFVGIMTFPNKSLVSTSFCLIATYFSFFGVIF